MQIMFVSVFLLVSFGETLVRGENTNFRPKHLFVQRKAPLRGSSLPHRTIYLPTDGNGSSKHSLKESSNTRTKRSTREERSIHTDPEHTLHEFNDQHYMLLVQWSGFSFSDTVVVLSRDIRPTSQSTSYLYVSNNYGKSYTNQSHKLSYTADDGSTKHALIETFYTSPVNAKWYIFADTTNNWIFTSKDDCETLKAVNLTFKPSDITFHASKSHGLMAYDDSTRMIYYSKDFGFTWNEREKNVLSYFWGFENLDSDDIVYLEVDNGDSTSDVIRGHFGHKHYSPFHVLKNVSDFEINDVYMFATRKSKNGLDLIVGYHYLNPSLAEFPNDLRRKEYFIADASENQVFVAVNHNLNTSHLYISDVTGKKYTLSMERILLFSPKQQKNHWLRRYADETFIDFNPIASMRGVYIASQVSRGKVGTRDVYTQISENKGRSWKNVPTPKRYANGSLVNCSSDCSLHLALQFAGKHPRYFGPTIMSKPSAPGLIVSSGNIGKRLSYGSNVFVSNDAGESWLEVLEGRWWYNFGDHGGVLVAVRHWSKTKELKYSTDEGLTWKTYTFTDKSIRVYGLLTEPGEKTTIFTVFGSYAGRHHSWLVVQVNFTKVLGSPCTSHDYEKWSPFHRKHDTGCILGQRLVYERRKRSSICYNGHNYDRPINREICRCKGYDYECDVGFVQTWGILCGKDYHASFDPYAPPRPCPRGGKFNKTQGYRKISGDKCSGGFDFFFGPEETSCPFNVDKAFLMYAELSTIKYLDLVNDSLSTALDGLRGAVAVAYDIREGYIYWADMIAHKIMRRTFNRTDDEITIAGIKQVEGLDFDWTTDNLYWIDSVEKVIEVCRKDGLFRKAVHSTDLDKPRALALDPAMGEMFWSDWGNPAKIEMSDMDGSNRKILVKSGIVWPNGLAIDINKPRQSRVLYYTDASKDIIGSYDMHTKKTKILASRSSRNGLWKSILIHPYSIAVDDINVYWDDWSTGKVYKIHKSFKGTPVTLIEKAKTLDAKSRYEIKVYYRRSQMDTSGCSGVSCPQLCLPKPNNVHVCECGDGMKVVPSTKKCKCIGGLITLANGTCKRPSGKRCAPHEFACRNGECIQPEWRCDWDDDCGDQSDEDGCTNKCSHADEYPCPDGRCIPQAYVCNGYRDCEDGVDERYCTTNKTGCVGNEFRCSDGLCIHNGSICDGKNDCTDNADEMNCTADKPGCVGNEFRCSDGLCIHNGSICDGKKDCTDNADEMNCTAVVGKRKSGSKKTLMWAIPVGIVFAVLLGALVYFVVKSRRLQRRFYHLVRSDSSDHAVTYHNDGDDDTPLLQGFSDDDPLVEA